MFYDKYEELCRKRGISPFAAARHLGISSRTQGNWKKGSAPRFGTLLKIAEYFNVDMSYFDDEITHECRHTTATMLAKSGVQPAIITDIMRHTSYTQTMDYTHTGREDMIKGIEKIIR